jgi:hypothetical protein
MKFDADPAAYPQLNIVGDPPCLRDGIVERSVERCDIRLHAHHSGNV